MSDPTTLEDIENAIPDDRKNLSFGDEGEDIIDVMENHEKEQHLHGKHMDDELDTCPYCPDPDNKHVSVTITGDEI